MHYTAPAELLETFSVFVAPDIEDENIDLLRAALVIARTEYPDLAIEEYTGRVESLALPRCVPGQRLRAAHAAVR